MIRLTKLSDYGIQLLAALVRAPDGYNARDLVLLTGIHEPTVRKLLKILSGAGLLVSRRGIRGGYRLARPAEEISVAEAIAAIEGPVSLTECNSPDGACERMAECSMHGGWQRVNEVIRKTLTDLTLSQLAAAMPVPGVLPAGGRGTP